MTNYLIQYSTRYNQTNLVNIEANSKEEAIKKVKAWREVMSAE